MINNYVCYHLHSEDSLLDSATNFKDYVKLAASLGQTAIASTEHGKPTGHVGKRFFCEENGIKFIHGVEIYLTESLTEKVRDNYHTILLAKNEEGFHELNKLVSMSCDKEHFYYVNRLSFDEFLKISDNIITTSACLASPLNKLDSNNPWFDKLARRYDFFEIQPHNDSDQKIFNQRLYELSKVYNKPLVAGTDTHSLNTYKAECRKIITDAKGKSYNDDTFDLTYKKLDDLVEMFRVQGVLPEKIIENAIQNTNFINEMVEDYSLDRSIKYPILYGTREEDAKVFEETVERKFKEKLDTGVIPQEQKQAFREAIDEEMRVFKKLKMDAFMLSMSELISWCKENDIAIGTARGSVGGSRVAYVTDIIDLNPETWHTVFSRFANENREEIGDIDIDCVDTDRPKIFNYIIERFGRNKTARVASYGTLVEKGAMDEIGRAFKVRYEREHGKDADNPWEPRLKKVDGIKKEYEKNPSAAREKYPDFFYYLDGLMNVKISQSVHPAGMVISPITLDDNYGTFDKDGENCLMVDMEEAHEIGLAKYDFLILKTVTVLRDTCKSLGRKYPKTYEIDWNDQAVWEDMITAPYALFQFESAYGFDCLKKYKPQSIFDMSLVTACIRPSGASYRDDLLARVPHKNPSELIDDLLADNNGYLIYQEDTIKFLQQICGLSGSAADNIRRAIGRKQKDRLDAALPEILEGYCAKSSQPREVAENEAKEFLQVIEDSASYQFGYNHSIGYCLLGYLTAYYRYHYPLEFITSFLNNAANDDDINNGTMLAKQKGIAITSPRFGISRGEYFFDKEKRIIAKGLASIKYMGSAIADELYELAQNNTYKYFIDLLHDIDEKTGLNSHQLEILIKIDFFSDFGNQRELLKIVDIYNLFKKGEAKQIKKTTIDGTPLESVVKKYSVGVTKSGGVAKSYTLLDVMSILRESELVIKNAGLEDISDLLKVQNFYDIMGYIGYISNKPEDRRKLYVTDVKPLKRKSDDALFAYSVFTKSIGSGIESRFTTFCRVFNKDPIKAGDIIFCKKFERDGAYFRLTDYEHIL